MTIAAVTDDGFTISQHFGRAPAFEVLVIDGGEVVRRERRAKLGHAQFAAEPHHHDHAPGAAHGVDAAAQSRHGRMVEAIRDCDVLLAGGMGAGAYQSLRQAGIRPIVTDVRSIDEAVQQVVDGTIVDRIDRLH
jgi:predicted Fe-Mo cluster-binding NifX family protein